MPISEVGHFHFRVFSDFRGLMASVFVIFVPFC
jgi:hypothetical protein